MADLWIRNQTRTKLVKVNELNLERDEEMLDEYGDVNINYDIWANHDDIMGTYGTKERALEVLDEIQKLLMTVDTLVVENFDLTEKNIEDFTKNKIDILPFKTEDSPKLYYINKSCVVYEMPES